MSDMNVSGHVIEMSDKHGIRKFSACSQVEAYWESLRGAQLVPGRTQIDPRGIEGALNNAFILEDIGAGHARFRIAGTQLCDLMGMEVRGMPVGSFMVPASRDAFARAMSAVLQGPAVMRLTLRGEGQWGQPALDAKMLLLPLTDESGQINRVLGCLETQGTIGRAPRRFELLNAEKRRLEQPEWDASLEPELEDNAELEHGFAEASPLFERPTTENKKARPSYLRLIKTDT